TGNHDIWDSVLDSPIGVYLIGKDRLLYPLDAVLAGDLCQLNRVRHIECHIAIKHNVSICSDQLARFLDILLVFLEAFLSVDGPIANWNLNVPESHLFMALGINAGGISSQSILSLATYELVNR